MASVKNLTSTNPTILAKSWTEQWLNDLGTTQSMYDDYSSGIDDYGKLADTLNDEWLAYEEKFGPMRDQLLELSGTDMGRREQLAEQFMQLATADYEGEAARASAGVVHQTENARGQLRRSLGQTSKAQLTAAMTQMASDEAKNKVLASTQAKLAEKNRLAGVTTTGMTMFDPVKTASAAADIQNSKNSLLTQQAGVRQNEAVLKGNLASSYNKDITEQTGSLANAYQGMQVAAALTNSSANKPKVTTTYGGMINPGSGFSPEAIASTSADFFSPTSPASDSTLKYGDRGGSLGFGLL